MVIQLRFQLRIGPCRKWQYQQKKTGIPVFSHNQYYADNYHQVKRVCEEQDGC